MRYITHLLSLVKIQVPAGKNDMEKRCAVAGTSFSRTDRQAVLFHIKFQFFRLVLEGDFHAFHAAVA